MARRPLAMVIGTALAALVGTLALAVAWPTGASAQGRIVLRRPVLVTLLPPGDLVAGGTPQTLAFVVTDDTGGLARDVSFRGTGAEIGTLTSFTQLGPGVFTCLYTAPPIAAERDVDLTIKVKVGGQAVTRNATLHVVPPPRRQFAMQATPERIVLGQDELSVLTFIAADNSGQPLDGLHLAVQASLGEVGEVSAMGGGAYRVEYRPPDTRRPGLAILSVVDMDNPETSYGFMAMPLVGAPTWKLETGLPGVRVGMNVGGEVFGPVTADDAGVAMIPILVPPGVTTAQAIAVQPDGTEMPPVEVSLNPPPFRRLKLAPTAPELPGDGRSPFPIYAFVLGPDARPLAANAPIQIHTKEGGITALNNLGDGVYQAIYVPPAVSEPVREKVSFSLAGSEDVDLEAVLFDVIPPLPDALTFTTEPAEVPAGEQTIVLRGVLDSVTETLPGGTGVSFASDAGVIPMQRAVGGGTFEADWTATFDGPVALSAEALVPASTRAVAQLVAWPVQDQVLVNGQVPIVAMALDRYGLPVSGVRLSATTQNDTGTVAGGGVTDHHGRAVFTFQATPLPGMAVVSITDGTHGVGVPLWQTEVVLVGFQFPLHGGAQQVAMMQRWGSLRGRLLVGAGAPAPAVTERPPAESEEVSAAAADAAAAATAAGEPEEEKTPWWEAARAAGGEGSTAAGGTTDATNTLSAEVRAALSTGETEVRALREVELVPTGEDDAYDIAVRYSHAATVVVVAGQKLQLDPEDWFAGWAALIGKYTRNSTFRSRDFRLTDEDSGRTMVLSTADCRKVAGYGDARRNDYVRSHMTVE